MSNITNFILFHKGNNLPQHIRVCVDQIKKTQTNYKIFLLTDLKIDNRGDVNIIDINEYNIPLNEITYYADHQDPLWRTAFERLFYINEFIKQYSLTNVVHFDNDVLIYKNIADISTLLNSNIPNIGLTPHKENELVCGFMFIKNSNSLEIVCKELLNLAILGENKLEEMLKSMPHEMRLLGHLQNNVLEKDVITSLPVSPIDPGNNLFNIFKGVFDPSSYGQFFGLDNTIHPDGANRFIDRHINKYLAPVFDVYQPYVVWDNKEIPIFNLHIHNKHLERYASR
tara:strand:+ start:1690 stop:2541 length:852 start_codon:yes stop_codon:yes gene_type:complete